MLFVIPSPTDPVSELSASTKLSAAGARVSSVKVKGLLAVPTLPATSVWRTSTLLAPGAGLKLLLQFVPPSMLYSTKAPCSAPATLIAPLLVILSAVLVPVSLVRLSVGAAALVSSEITVLVAALARLSRVLCRSV